ncbi:MAG TPA: hypothetical protein VFW84_02640 [Aquabacterium sp.]|uniref:hypothetical protein n=1 Tax=Aquabacterium sp. TaxID=1872578 RepID=UPI002E36CDB0|nr:hypothetical protein [Aquabacterium sp.]HEX5371610.1 hypothetical protein [Aquabacterium sp.]
MTHQSFKEFFNGLSDEELIKRVTNGLTEEAYSAACDELSARGISTPAIAVNNGTQDEDELYLGDMVLLTDNLDPTEANILAACLASAGVHASTGDADTVRANPLWAIALGGAKIRVPLSQFEEAKKVLKAFQAGEFALSDDFDVGEPSP